MAWYDGLFSALNQGNVNAAGQFAGNDAVPPQPAQVDPTLANNYNALLHAFLSGGGPQQTAGFPQPQLNLDAPATQTQGGAPKPIAPPTMPLTPATVQQAPGQPQPQQSPTPGSPNAQPPPAPDQSRLNLFRSLMANNATGANQPVPSWYTSKLIPIAMMLTGMGAGMNRPGGNFAQGAALGMQNMGELNKEKLAYAGLMATRANANANLAANVAKLLPEQPNFVTLPDGTKGVQTGNRFTQIKPTTPTKPLGNLDNLRTTTGADGTIYYDMGGGKVGHIAPDRAGNVVMLGNDGKPMATFSPHTVLHNAPHTPGSTAGGQLMVKTNPDGTKSYSFAPKTAGTTIDPSQGDPYVKPNATVDKTAAILQALDLPSPGASNPVAAPAGQANVPQANLNATLSAIPVGQSQVIGGIQYTRTGPTSFSRKQVGQ